MLEGDDPRVQQKLTSTDCYYRKNFCAPKESPDTKIVWTSAKHDSSIYHSMGIFPVKQIDNYFLVPNLGIGGSSIEEDENAYLLDTGYQIIKKNKGTYHVPKCNDSSVTQETVLSKVHSSDMFPYQCSQIQVSMFRQMIQSSTSWML